MTTEPTDGPTDYPDQWKGPEVRRREASIDLTEAELWLGSLTAAELQATLARARKDH